MLEQRTGRIVKWVGDSSKGWGLINSYRSGVTRPDKFFVHASWVKTNSLLFAGLHVMFTPGPSRTEKELPTAQEVHVTEILVEGNGAAAAQILEASKKEGTGSRQ